MNSHSLVSVIIIFLNEEKFLQEAIDSVLAQTYEYWELLLVDDGSTDGSTKIARTYAEKYPEKVRYLSHFCHANRGMSDSRNLGVRNAKGKYISYLDGDDVWFSNKLERQIAIVKSHPEAVMVYGPLQRWYSWTGNPQDMQRDDLYGLHARDAYITGDTLIKPPELLSRFLPHESLIPGGILVEKAVIEGVGGYEETFRGSYEDAVVLVKLCLTSTVFVSNECWYRYRIHPASHERLAIKAGLADSNRLFFLHWVEKYLSKQGVKDPEVRQALQNAFWPYHHPKSHRLLEGFRSLIKQIEGLIIQIGSPILPVHLRNRLWNIRQRYTKI